MNDNLQKLLEGASQDELALCVQLLALNIAQYRAKFGLVTFQKSMEQLRASAEGTQSSRFIEQGREVLDEVLEMVRVLSAERSGPEESVSDDTPRRENRRQFRINVNAPIKILWPDAATPAKAQLENISWGGAVIQIEDKKVDAGDTLRILLPGQNGSISIEASILRTWPLADGKGMAVATRFSSLRTSDEAALEVFLERLAHSADDQGSRNKARLTQRLDIEFNDIEELEATLDDISAGGLGITVPEPLQIGHSLQAVISTLDGTCCLKLRARVVRQDALNIRNIEFYRVGLKFEHPTEELYESVNELIRKIAKVKNSKND
ncbi:MAG: PilZ domain-containing protein [Halioglobus sp.]